MTCSSILSARLQEGFQETLAEAMMLRLQVEAEDAVQEAERPDCSGELDGRMTPPAQPANFEASSPVEPKVLAEKLDGVRRNSLGSRRTLDLAMKSRAASARRVHGFQPLLGRENVEMTWRSRS